MCSFRNWLTEFKWALAERLERLRLHLEQLADKVKEAVAETIGRTIAEAVQAAMRFVLDRWPERR